MRTAIVRSQALLSAAVLALLLLAQPAPAAERTGYCLAAGGFSAASRVVFEPASKKKWRLLRIYYTLRPGDSSSDHNNVNLTIWKGSRLWTWNSADNLKRDGREHLLRSWADFRVLKGGTHLFAVNLFDTFGKDPGCQIQIDL